MDEGSAATTPPNGETQAQPAEGDPPLTADLVKSMFDAGFAKYRKQINGEMARFRKTPQADQAPSDSAPPAPLTREQVAEMVADAQRLGTLEASVPQTLRDAHAERMTGMDPGARTAFLEGLAAGHSAAPRNAGETPAQPSARAPNSAPRTTVPYPTSQTEYFELSITDPKRRAALDADANFDVSELEPF